MNFELRIGRTLCDVELFNFEFRIMLARNAASWLAPSFWRGMGEAHIFNYSMNSLRSYSISYLVAQAKVETRYNKKNLHAFQPFRAKCRHACRLEFLADFL